MITLERLRVDNLNKALDEGRIEIAVQGDKWFKARRNGQTKLWSTRPSEFSIPVKVGFTTCARLDHTWVEDRDYRELPA